MFRILINALLTVILSAGPAFAYYGNGSSFDGMTVYRGNGSTWDAVTWYRGNGTAFVDITEGGSGCTEPPSGAILYQNFEGTGYDNSESWTGTADSDYTGIVLRGSQSLEIASGETINSPTFTAQDDFWFFFRVELTGAIGSNSYLYFKDSAETTHVNVRFTTSETISAYSGGIAATSGVLTASVPYAVWIHFVQGSGSTDGEVYLYVDTVANVCSGGTCTRPSLTASTTSGTWDSADNAVTHITSSFGSTNELIFDQFYISATEISTVCE